MLRKQHITGFDIAIFWKKYCDGVQYVGFSDSYKISALRVFHGLPQPAGIIGFLKRRELEDREN